MSSPALRLPGPSAGTHPAVRSRRIRDLLVIGGAGLLAMVLALGISIETPKPNYVLVAGGAVLMLGIVLLFVSTRLEVTVAIVALYLGLLDGPVKLLSASQSASALRDVLILTIALGALMRAIVSKQRLSMPPLSAWVLGFTVVVLAEAANPATNGFLKIIGGYRQQLEFVPFFFFGYLLMRSKDRFRKLFLIIGVISLANGLVGAYQSRIGPGALSSWGPGYNARINGTNRAATGHGTTGRKYVVEGVSMVRPPALGSDSGFGGDVGVLALPLALALLSVGYRRRRWVPPLLCIGALAGIATSASRTSIILALVGVASFVGLSLIAGLRIGRPVAALLVFSALAFGVGAVLVSVDGAGIFHRQETLAEPESNESSSKAEHIEALPKDIEHGPFGYGLGTSGAAAGFGGRDHPTIEGKSISGESSYNLVTLEVGFPGLLLWVGLTINVLVLVLQGLKRVVDPELRTYLVAVFAVFIAFTLAGFSGATTAATPGGPYLWFAIGIAAYWFAGPGRARRAAASGRTEPTPMPTLAAEAT